MSRVKSILAIGLLAGALLGAGCGNKVEPEDTRAPATTSTANEPAPVTSNLQGRPLSPGSMPGGKPLGKK